MVRELGSSFDAVLFGLLLLLLVGLLIVVRRSSKSDSQQVEVVDVASDVNRVLQGPDDLICHRANREEDHHVIGKASCTDANARKERHGYTSQFALTTRQHLKTKERICFQERSKKRDVGKWQKWRVVKM